MKYEEIADAKDALTFALEALNDDNLDAVYLTAYGRYDVFDIPIALLEDAVADADDDYELIKSIETRWATDASLSISPRAMSRAEARCTASPSSTVRSAKSSIRC